VVLIIGLGGYRLSLIHTGRFHFGDERKYKLATFAVDELARGDVRAAVARVSDSYGGGRPGFVLLGMIPATLQHAAEKHGLVSRYKLEYFLIPAVFNVLVTLVIALVIFLLGRRWTGSDRTALAATVVYSLLFNTSAYVRHLVPYDESLALFLWALLIITCEESLPAHPVRRGILAGVLSGLGFACYPGYYAFPVILAAVCLSAPTRRAARLAAYAVSSAAVLGAFEILSRVGGSSYLSQLSGLSSTITMGDFEEGYAYAWRYLKDVEGAAGVMLLVLFGIFVALIVWRRNCGLSPTLRVAIPVALGCYLWHATMGTVLHYMVFYGRIVHMYVPFLVLGAVAALTRLPRRNLRQAGFAVLLVVSFASFVPTARRYSSLTYPGELFELTVAQCGLPIGDAARRLWVRSGGRIDHPAVPDHPLVIMVMEEWPDGMKGYIHVASHQAARNSNADFILVNMNWMFLPDRKDEAFVPPSSYKIIEEAVHPNNFPGNAYEAYGPEQRERLKQRFYYMRIYQRSSGTGF